MLKQRREKRIDKAVQVRAIVNAVLAATPTWRLVQELEGRSDASFVRLGCDEDRLTEGPCTVIEVVA